MLRGHSTPKVETFRKTAEFETIGRFEARKALTPRTLIPDQTGSDIQPETPNYTMGRRVDPNSKPQNPQLLSLTRPPQTILVYRIEVLEFSGCLVS